MCRNTRFYFFKVLPLFFSLYINDLTNAFKYCTIHDFADNTNLLYTNNNNPNLKEIMKAELKRLAN